MRRQPQNIRYCKYLVYTPDCLYSNEHYNVVELLDFIIVADVTDAGPVYYKQLPFLPKEVTVLVFLVFFVSSSLCG